MVILLTKHTIEFSSNTPIQHLNLLFRASFTIERSFMLFSLLPRSRGNSINYTSVLYVMQIRFPWFTPQCFFPKLLQHHHSDDQESSKQETKTLYNWKSFNRFWLGETPKKFFVFPPRRGDSYNYTDAEMGLQPEIGWNGTQTWGFRFILTWTEY